MCHREFLTCCKVNLLPWLAPMAFAMSKRYTASDFSQAHLCLHIHVSSYVQRQVSYVNQGYRESFIHQDIYIFVDLWYGFLHDPVKWGVLIKFPMRSHRYCDRFNRSIIRYLRLSTLSAVRPQCTHLQLHTRSPYFHDEKTTRYHILYWDATT